jgi:DNA-directed RNA polymerase specialized sigma24 family protein
MISNPDMLPTVSLDAPISADTEDLTIADTIPDESAALALESAEDAMENQQLRARIDAALDCLPDDIAITIRLHDLDGLPLQEAADRQGIHYNTAQTRRRTGFNRLRKRQELLHWYNIPNYHRYKSLIAFKESWSSVVEDEVIRKLDRR